MRIPYADGILDNPDFLYTFTDLAIWSTLEIGLALAASSLATLTPLFRKMKFFASSSHGDSRTPAGPRPSFVRTVPTMPGRGTGVGGSGGRVGGSSLSSIADIGGGFRSDLELQPMDRLSSESNSRLKGAWRFEQL